jgi:hypothetical protein
VEIGARGCLFVVCWVRLQLGALGAIDIHSVIINDNDVKTRK